MKLNTNTLIECGYREYQDKDLKLYIASFDKVIENIRINIEVYKSIRGGIYYKIIYSYLGTDIYTLNTKDISIYNIEEVARIISRDIN